MNIDFDQVEAAVTKAMDLEMNPPKKHEVRVMVNGPFKEEWPKINQAILDYCEGNPGITELDILLLYPPREYIELTFHTK